MRSSSTVIREIRRNGWQSAREQTARGRVRVAGGYRCLLADRQARHLAVKPRVDRKQVPGDPLWQLVVGRFKFQVQRFQAIRWH